jgi:hypothetical protein
MLVPLTGELTAKCSPEDYADLIQFRWHAWRSKHTWYAGRNLGVRSTPRREVMHRRILCPPDGLLTDHRNGDGLDNRRGNLRAATQAQNHANRRKTVGTSKYLGVNWAPPEGKWRAVICTNRRAKFLGLFHDEDDAARAYDRAAREIHGEFARLNFPDSSEPPRQRAKVRTCVAAVEVMRERGMSSLSHHDADACAEIAARARISATGEAATHALLRALAVHPGELVYRRLETTQPRAPSRIFYLPEASSRTP